MTSMAALPGAELRTSRLVLEPLTVAHAGRMFAILSDPTIYEHLDHGPPPSLEHLQDVYRRLALRRSPDGSEAWLNWIVMHRDHGPLGVVQATVLGSEDAAWVAYLLSKPYRGFGYAREAVAAMLDHLAGTLGVRTMLAMIEDANQPSRGLLLRLGFREASVAQLGRWGGDMTPSERLFVRSL